ncbi:IQ and ubiquitin-like domain-containing protein isoform X3 [Numida meleagris]|uniref:IQ and ubiquitin-like domain-containing protein isoform X3 n=1 Tax=Numida meleagris TaxID=8996 RepID=UPI000B3E2790|nr:IQ and ubiquitin-like domain-containing protein isoform X3 [Numida meleagris]
MEGASESCSEAVPAGTWSGEQPPAGPRQAGSTEPSREALLCPAASTMQADEGCKLPASQGQAGAALQELPGEGLGHHEVMGDGDQGVLEPEGPFSASPENASPVTITNSSTLPELRSSEREEETSQSAALSENTASSTVTGSIIESTQTVTWSWAEFHETIQCEKLCLDLGVLPSKAAQQGYHMPDVITVRVQMDSDSFHNVAVKIERPTFRKPFLGGFKNRVTGVEFHHAGSQTVPKKRPEKGTTLFCRETQTVFERNKYQQTTNPTSTQMTKRGVYVSNMSDKLITPGKYLTAEEYHKRRLEAVIVLQKYFRRWYARNLVQNLKEKKRLRLEWEAQEELQRKKEKEDKLRMEQERKLNPKTKEDFDLLYHALESWRQEEMERINRTLTGAERKAALCGLLEQETELIASIGRHKLNAEEENQQKAVLHFLHKCAQPKRWKACDGKITEMDTQYTLRARELLEIYRSVSMNDIPKDERRDVLLMLRGTVKVPPDPLKLYKNVHFCRSCENYLSATEFPIPANSRTIGRCHLCCKLDNEARRRESFLKYRLILENLRKSEVDYQDDAKIVFLVQQQHLQYMIENIWGCQSALSACNDLYDLVMVRWDKQQEWSPWNTILLTKDEADAHLKLCNLQEAYEPSFIHGIKHKHIRAKKYFAQIPVMTSLFRRSDKQANAS